MQPIPNCCNFFRRFQGENVIDNVIDEEAAINPNSQQQPNLYQQLDQNIDQLIKNYGQFAKHLPDSFIKKLASTIPGTGTNMALYLTLTLVAPGFQYSGPIASFSGAFVNATTQWCMGINNAQTYQFRIKHTIHSLIGSTPFSEGVRHMPFWSAIPNEPTQIALQTILPALTQAVVSTKAVDNARVEELQKENKQVIQQLEQIQSQYMAQEGGEERFKHDLRAIIHSKTTCDNVAYAQQQSHNNDEDEEQSKQLEQDIFRALKKMK